MRSTFLSIALVVVGVSPPTALMAQHTSTAPGGTAHPTPAPSAATAPATAKPSQGDAHGPAAAAPAPKPGASPASTDTHGHAAVPAAKTTTKKKANEPDMAGVIERIQQRIATEVGTGTAPAARARATAGARATGAASGSAVATRPRVTLNWRTTLTWPAELLPAAPAPEPPTDPVLLIWR